MDVYVFRWLITVGPTCPSYQSDVEIYTASTAPTDANAGPDQVVCEYTGLPCCYTTTSLLFEIGTWTVSPSAGVIFSNIHDPHAVVTGLLPYTTYTFTWTVANGCGSAIDFMTVDVTDTPGPVQANAGPDQCLGPE